jgi:hypothetical protein
MLNTTSSIFGFLIPIIISFCQKGKGQADGGDQNQDGFDCAGRSEGEGWSIGKWENNKIHTRPHHDAVKYSGDQCIERIQFQRSVEHQENQCPDEGDAEMKKYSERQHRIAARERACPKNATCNKLKGFPTTTVPANNAGMKGLLSFIHELKNRP